MEAAIARFESRPSQRLVDELSELLDRQIATPEQGERILKMLLYPEVTVRAAYPAGVPPNFSMERCFDVHFPHSTVSRSAELWADGEEQYGSSADGGGDFDTSPRFYRLNPVPKAPGLYAAEIRYEYGITPMAVRTTWSWNPRSGPLPWSLLPRQRAVHSSSPHSTELYACRFSVPVELTVVEEERAERIGLLTYTRLDHEMQRAFTAGPARVGGSYSTPAGRRTYAGGVEITYDALPVAVAFKPTLRLADHDVSPHRDYLPRPLRARASASGKFHLMPVHFQLEEPADYDATIVLTPDPDYAYQDPAIKAIWNGTLEFPISFFIREEPEPAPR